MECRDCGKEFDPRSKRQGMRGGYIDQCAQCSRGDRDSMYVGRPGATHKGANIEIFRSNLKTVRSVIRGENAVGYGASVRISSEAFERNKGAFGGDPDDTDYVGSNGNDNQNSQNSHGQ